MQLIEQQKGLLIPSDTGVSQITDFFVKLRKIQAKYPSCFATSVFVPRSHQEERIVCESHRLLMVNYDKCTCIVV